MTFTSSLMPFNQSLDGVIPIFLHRLLRLLIIKNGKKNEY